MLSTRFALSALIALPMILGCATSPVKNRPLDHFSPECGYRLEATSPDEKNSDSLFVLLTFSGGGTRAAAFSYGVLETLRDTEIEWEGERRRLLDEVDVISSVSGGSLTSAYYGLFGDRIFEDFPDKVLYKSIQGALIRKALTVKNWVRFASPRYSRTDVMADGFDRKIFEGKTFGDLMAQNRPYIVINSTDLSRGRPFAFTQDHFDLLYSDLGSFHVGHAVAASAAVPGAFAPMTLKNHEKGPDFELPDWVQEELAQRNYGTLDYRLAKEMQSLSSGERPYVHLVDGGVADNLGLLPVILAFRDMETHKIPGLSFTDGSIRKVIIVTVNAVHETQTKWDLKQGPMGFVKTLAAAGTAPIGNFSQAEIEYIKLLIKDLTEEQRIRDEISKHVEDQGLDFDLGLPELPQAEFHFAEVAFDRIEDDDRREALSVIPTSFKLPRESVDELRKSARDILDNHPAFQAAIR